MSDEWKQVVAKWEGGEAFIGQNPAGASVQMGALDGKPGISPMEMLLLGAAGCTGIDIVSILKKKQLKLDRLEVHVKGKRADIYPRVYTEIEVNYLLWGENLDRKAIEQAIVLSEEKYCSASNMLRATAKMRSSYRVLAPGEELGDQAQIIRVEN
jgi:putative redox protein